MVIDDLMGLMTWCNSSFSFSFSSLSPPLRAPDAVECAWTRPPYRQFRMLWGTPGPEHMSDRMPERLPDRMPDRMSEHMSDRMPETTAR